MDPSQLFWYATPSHLQLRSPEHLPAKDTRPLGMLLKTYETAISLVNPDGLKFLNQGISTQEIALLEQKYGAKIPEEVIELYMWHNGETEAPGEYKMHIFPYGRFVPLGESLKVRQLRIEAIKQSNKSLRKFHDDLLGHESMWLECVAETSGFGLYFDIGPKANDTKLVHKIDNGEYYYFPSISNGIAMLVDAANSGLIQDAEFGLSLKDSYNGIGLSDLRNKYGVLVRLEE